MFPSHLHPRLFFLLREKGNGRTEHSGGQTGEEKHLRWKKSPPVPGNKAVKTERTGEEIRPEIRPEIRSGIRETDEGRESSGKRIIRKENRQGRESRE